LFLHLIYKLASSAAQKVLAAHVSALFEGALRLNESLTGSRYLMGINNIGKLNHTPAISDIQGVANGYRELAERFTKLYKHSLANYNYLDRLHSAGTITPVQAGKLGLTGPSLRACGINRPTTGDAQRPPEARARPLPPNQKGRGLPRPFVFLGTSDQKWIARP